MAHSLSAKKRIRQNAKRRTINRARKSMVKTQTKRFLETVAQGDAEQAAGQLKALTRKLDKLACSSTLHRNTVARIKSRMARKVATLR